jgi:hypothetical protein
VDDLDGGPGRDTASFVEQPVGLRADLPGHRTDDGGALASIESVTGGLAADVLTGDGHSNDLLAGLGNDVLYGGAGNDVLDGGPGRDEITCGSGRDTVVASRPTDHIQFDCERLTFEPDRLLEPGEEPRFSYVVPPYANFRRKHFVEYRLGCPVWRTIGRVPCSIMLTLHQSGHSKVVLGRGKLKRGTGVRKMRVRLTRTGTRLAVRDNGVQVKLSLSGTRVPSVGWSIGLHVPNF